MSLFRVAVTAVGVAAALSRHPAVRVGLKAAPLLVTPRLREIAKEAALDGAYRAGVAARAIMPKSGLRE